VPVGLEPLEDLLPVVQHGRGRVELDWTVGLHPWAVPASARRPADVDHVVGEVLAEPRVGEDLRALDLGERLGVEPTGEVECGRSEQVFHVIPISYEY